MSALSKVEAASEPPLSRCLSVDPSAFIHPLAHVERAKIGPRTRVWQFASVVRGAILGADCTVASGVTIDGVRFGDRCIISQGVTTAPGYWFGDDVFIGPNVTICNDVWPATSKDGFDIGAMLDGRWTVVVNNGASIGAGAVVLPGVVIGRRAMIAAGAIVTKAVPADHIMTRGGRIVPIDPARIPPRMRLV